MTEPGDSALRCGSLTSDDLDRIVEIHRAAFPESAMTQLGRQVVRRYYEWQFIGPHPDPVALGIWREGSLVGFLFGGRRRGAVAGFVRSSLRSLAWGAVTHPRAVSRLSAAKVLPVVRAASGHSRSARATVETTSGFSMPAPSFGVLSIAVTPNERGSGVAGELLQRAEAVAIGASYRGMHLSVDATNVRAINFYRKHRWEDIGAAGETARLMVKLLRDN